MRSIHCTHLPSPRLLPALAVLLALAACEREITRHEARPGAQPRSAIFTAPAGGRVAGLNEHGEIAVSNYRWTRAGAVEYLPSSAGASAVDINNAGLVLGNVSLPGGGWQPMVWAPGGEPQPISGEPGWPVEFPAAVNDAGVVAAWGWTDAGYRSFRWSASEGTRLLPPAWSLEEPNRYNTNEEMAVAINGAGDILGIFELSCQNEGGLYPCPDGARMSGAVVWKASGQVVKMRWGGSNMQVRAFDLNDAGTVVGSHDGQAALWSADGVLRIIAPSGSARAVSETGVVVGSYSVAGQTHAFRWTEGGGVEDLGTLGGAASAAADVNDHGDVTGWARTADGVARAFIWTRERGMRALDPAPDAGPSAGLFINGAREVAGTASNGEGVTMWPARWNDLASARPPVADAGGPYTGRLSGRRYTYTAAGSSDVDGPALRYSWDMNGDGVFEGVTNAPLFGYAYPAGGSYTIRLEVRDGRGLRDTATTTATIAQNVAPVATLTGVPTSLAEGAPLTPTVAVRDANQAGDSTELPLMRYRWEWGDGAVSAAKSTGHRYADQGTYTIRLIVTDAGGLADTVVRTLPVGNVAPTARFSSPASIREGTPFTLTASALSDAPADVAAGLLVAFNCGGRLGEYGTARTIVCPGLADQGSLTVGMRVVDKDFKSSGTTRTIAVGNAAPEVTAEAATATTFAAGGSFTIHGGFTDAGTKDGPWQYRVYWGDGASLPLDHVPFGALITGTHVYATPGSYNVVVAVVDADGGSGRSAPVAVTVTP